MKLVCDTSRADTRSKLLLVDDGRLVTPALTQALAAGGFRVELVSDPEHALADSRGQRYDAVAINADLPTIDAGCLCLTLRAQGCSSVIVIIGAASSDTDELAAWRAGATDRIAQATPEDAFVERLAARVDGARVKAMGLLYPVSAELLTLRGRLALALVPTVVTLDDEIVSLTRIEERLFARLWAAQGTPVPADELIASAWLGRKAATTTLRVHLHQLRRKLTPLGLTVERSGDGGYRLPSLMPAVA